MMLPVVTVEVRCSGVNGGWSAHWGWRRVRITPDVVHDWCNKVQRGTSDGVAIIIRKTS